MRKSAILINSIHGGGAERIVIELLDQFKKVGFTPLLICIDKESSYDISHVENIVYFNKGRLTKNPVIKFLLIFIYAFRLKKIVKKHHLSLIQSHLSRSNYINLLSKVFGSSHSVQIVNHTAISSYRNKGVLGRINLFLIKRLYRFADLIISIAKAMNDEINSMFRLKNQCMVINNPFDINHIETLSKEVIDNENFSFQKDKKYIVFMGRLVVEKRVLNLIEATFDLLNRHNQYEMLIIGEGDQKDQLEKRIKEKNMSQRIHLLGWQDNPFSIMSRCDIFVSASENEGFPNAIIESMICGVAIVHTDCLTGPREILAPDTDCNKVLQEGFRIEQFGLLTALYDDKALIDAMEFLINNENKRKELILSARKRVDDFNFEKNVNKYLKIME